MALPWWNADLPQQPGIMTPFHKHSHEDLTKQRLITSVMWCSAVISPGGSPDSRRWWRTRRRPSRHCWPPAQNLLETETQQTRHHLTVTSTWTHVIYTSLTSLRNSQSFEHSNKQLFVHLFIQVFIYPESKGDFWWRVVFLQWYLHSLSFTIFMMTSSRKTAPAARAVLSFTTETLNRNSALKTLSLFLLTSWWLFLLSHTVTKTSKALQKGHERNPFRVFPRKLWNILLLWDWAGKMKAGIPQVTQLIFPPRLILSVFNMSTVQSQSITH